MGGGGRRLLLNGGEGEKGQRERTEIGDIHPLCELTIYTRLAMGGLGIRLQRLCANDLAGKNPSFGDHDQQKNSHRLHVVLLRQLIKLLY